MNLITTISGEKANIIGLGSNPQMDIQCIEEAYKGRINYFFFYSLDSSQLVQEFAKLTKNHRQDLIIATGSEERKIDILEVYIRNFCQQLSIETIDIFLLEYISPQDDINEINELLNQLQNWKTKGIIRYVGISCHDQNLAVKFMDEEEYILWQKYGDLIYGKGKDDFETQWL